MALTVVSWNIQKAIGLDLRRDLARTASVLASLDADVIGLQEVLRESGRDQAAWLGRELGMELAWGPARKTRRGEFGNAALVRGRAHVAEVHDVSASRVEPRACLEAVAEVGELRVRLFVCHFGLGLRERATQAERLVGIVRNAPTDVPRVVMGDFNEWHDGPVRRALRRAFANAPKTPPTHPAAAPMFALDRIAWDAGLDGTVTVPVVRFASDHRPLRATLSKVTA